MCYKKIPLFSILTSTLFHIAVVSIYNIDHFSLCLSYMYAYIIFFEKLQLIIWYNKFK